MGVYHFDDLLVFFIDVSRTSYGNEVNDFLLFSFFRGFLYVVQQRMSKKKGFFRAFFFRSLLVTAIRWEKQVSALAFSRSRTVAKNFASYDAACIHDIWNADFCWISEVASANIAETRMGKPFSGLIQRYLWIIIAETFCPSITDTNKHTHI